LSEVCKLNERHVKDQFMVWAENIKVHISRIKNNPFKEHKHFMSYIPSFI